MKIKSFEDLDIWKVSLKLTKIIYDLTAKSLFSKDFVLRDQIRRAVISISSNIVEGFEKNNNNELIRFLRIAKGSAGETRNQIIIAYTIGYITEAEFKFTNELIIDLSNQIGRFIVYLETNRKNGGFKRVNK
jgi:four helix bundle protein